MNDPNSTEQSSLPNPLAFEQVFESLPILYLLLSPDLYIVNASNEYLKATLTQRNKLIGKYIFDAFPDNPRTPEAKAVFNVQASLHQVLATRQPHQMARQQYDVPHPTEEGEFITCYWNPIHTPILNNKGEVSFILQHLVDVTEKVQMEAQLKASQEKEKLALAEAEHQRARLEKFLLEIPAAICIFSGPDFVYDFVNPRYQEQLFLNRDLLGKPLLEAVPEISGQPILQVLQQVYETGETSEGKEVLIPLAPYAGGPLVDHYFNYIQQARYNDKGQIDGIMTFAYDITELVMARKALEKRELALQELNHQLEAYNKDSIITNQALLQSQQALQNFNAELKEKVATRTREKSLAQAAVEQHRLRLEELFMQAPAPIVILSGPEFIFELVNPAYQAIFHGRELAGKPLLQALPEVNNTPILHILRQVYNSGETFVAQEMPVMLARKDGEPLEEIFFTFTYQVRRDIVGQIDGILAFGHEVTDQVMARKTVEANARQLRLVTDALPVLIAYLDKEEKYRFANQAYQPWFNYSPATLLGRHVRDVVGEKAYNGVKHFIDRALSGERLDFEARMPYRDDFVKYIKTSYIPDVQEGSVQGFYTLVNDVTDQVEARKLVEASEQQAKALADKLALANEELQAANEELTRTNVDLDNFIYTASHDLKSPILNIEGLLNVLREYLPPISLNSEDVQQVLEMIEGSVERFKQTIADLTEITRLQRKGNELTLVNLADIVAEVVLDLETQIQEVQAELIIDVAECEAISFSIKNLRSIVFNLISNAIKYHSPDRKPVIKISCRKEPSEWILTVQDNGLGMNLKEDTALFSMFHRLHDHVEGSGVGLYIVKRIMDNAQGTIEVDSQPGKGSTFTLHFKRN